MTFRNGFSRPARGATAFALVAAALLGSVTPGSVAAAASPNPDASCGSGTAVSYPSADTPKPIADSATTTSSVTVPAGAGFVHDVDVHVQIAHPWPADLDMTLTSPTGTVEVLTTDNGGGSDNVFSNTVFDDQADRTSPLPYDGTQRSVTDAVYADGVNRPSLVPEGALAGFEGEEAAGVWTLSVTDDAALDVGTLTSWSLELSTLAAQPQRLERSVRYLATPAVPDAGQVTANIVVAEQPGVVADLDLFTNIDHADDSQLDVFLTSPTGVTTTISTDNGAAQNRFGNVTFTDDGVGPVTDANFGAPLGKVTPEEAMAAFAGENEAGTWVVTVVDDTAGVTGSISNLVLTMRTASCVPAPAPPATSPRCGTAEDDAVGSSPGVVPIPDGGSVQSTIGIGSTGSVLRDLDVVVKTDFPYANLLGLTLESPSGTTIRLAEFFSGGGSLRQVRFDDEADPDGALPYVRNDGVLSDSGPRVGVPLGRSTAQDPLATFDGENPTGVWTLTATDQLAGAPSGNLIGWALYFRTTPIAPQGQVTSFPGTGAAVPGFGTLTRTVVVGGLTRPIVGVDVGFDLTEANPGYDSVALTSPAGTTVSLSTGNGAATANLFAGTTFSDGALQAVTDAGLVDLSAGVRPEEPLSSLAGEDPNGTWTLMVNDSTGASGTLNAWSLDLSTGECNIDPTAQPQSYSVFETAQSAIPIATGLLAGATDVEGDTLQVVGNTDPSHGVVEVAPDGSFLYTPVRRYRGPDAFTYTIDDGFGGQDTEAVTISVGAPVCSPPGPFTDVTEVHPFCHDILWMANDGITSGYADGSFKPSAAVTRQAMSAFLFRTANPGDPPPPVCTGALFSDVPQSHPFCRYIKWMVDTGVGGGYADGTFKPAASVTRQAMASFLAKLPPPAVTPACSVAPFPDVPTTHPFCAQIKWLVSLGITSGYADGNFKPSNAITRQAMAAFLKRYVWPA